jgi:hypothetical protein
MRTKPIRISVKLLVSLVILIGASLPEGSEWLAQAQQATLARPEPVPEVLADRISMAMRGLPASSLEREQLAAGTATPESLVERYSTEKSFENLMTLFWLNKMGIESRVSFGDTQIVLTGQNTKTALANTLRQTSRDHGVIRVVFLNQSQISGCSARLEMVYTRPAPPPQTEIDRAELGCNDMTLSEATRAQRCRVLATLRERVEHYRRFTKVHKCECGTEISVNPYWDPSQTLKACPGVVSSIHLDDADKVPQPTPKELCGAALQRCQPYDPTITPEARFFGIETSPQRMPQGSYLADVTQGVTEEPGRIISTIIAERGDFRNILTETKTRLTGPMESFFLSNVGRSLLNQLPPGTFRQGTDGPWNLDPGAGMRKTHRWVERGAGHAGVMTTWAFQQFTNGYRAKANRVYEAFLCQRFVIPPGVIESNVESDDLLVRQPCASCHVHLEPMASFFRRWEIEGVNYAYDASRSADGRFLVSGEWKNGKDARDLGEIVSNDPRFAECAAHRAFEFMMNRGPTEFERQRLLASITRSFNSGIDFLSALMAIVGSDSFRGGAQ